MQTENIEKALSYAVAMLWSWAISFVMPISEFLILTCALVCCDFITGVKAAHKRGEKIQSKGFRRTLSKTLMYFVAIFLSKGMEDVFGVPKLVYVVSGFIALTEFKSNLENISSFTGTNIWANLVARIPDITQLMKKQKSTDGESGTGSSE